MSQKSSLPQVTRFVSRGLMPDNHDDTPCKEAAALHDFQQGNQDGKGAWEEQGCSSPH